MLVRDIDRKLDMQLIFHVREDTELFNMTKNMKEKFPVFIFGLGDETWMSTYFPKIAGSNRLDVIMKKFRGIERDKAYVIDSRINSVRELKIISKLVEIPSFVINRSDMNDGFLNISARFHSSQMPLVSNEISKNTEDIQNLRVEWLGPNPGIMRTIDQINSEYPISLVTYINIIDENDEIVSELTSNVDTMAEIKNSKISEGMFRAVLYTNSPSVESIKGVTPISKKEGIFELDIRTELLAKIRDASNRDHLMRIRYFVKPNDGNLEVTVFLPTAILYEYYSVLNDITRKNGGKIITKYILPYTPDIWNFI